MGSLPDGFRAPAGADAAFPAGVTGIGACLRPLTSSHNAGSSCRPRARPGLSPRTPSPAVLCPQQHGSHAVGVGSTRTGSVPSPPQPPVLFRFLTLSSPS